MRLSKSRPWTRLAAPAVAIVLLACCLLPSVGTRPHPNPNELMRVRARAGHGLLGEP